MTQQVMEVTDMLPENDIKALDEFRLFVLEACEMAAVELIDNLEGVYANMDVQIFLDYIEDAIDEFTYDSMNYEDDDINDYD